MRPSSHPSESFESVTTTADYAYVTPIASGGMGRVDLVVCQKGRFHRLFAVKRLHAHLCEEEGFAEMFFEEARLAGLIRHPNVVSVVDTGEDASGPFLVMDYVEGIGAHQLISMARERGIELPIPLALIVAHDVARGLHAAHDLVGLGGQHLQIVHRDVSPPNILIGFDGTARLTDFGIAKALGRSTRTAAGVIKGKAAYMAPEQLLLRPATPQSDLYSLGIVLFEMLAAERLFGATESDLNQLSDGPPPDIGEYRDDVPSALVGLLFRLLASDTALRPASADIVAKELGRILAEIQKDGSSFDVGAYLRTHCADEWKVQRERVANGIEAAQEATGMTMRPQAFFRRRAVQSIAFVAAVAVIGAYWKWGGSETDSVAAAPDRTGPQQVAAPSEAAPADVVPTEPSPPKEAPPTQAEDAKADVDKPNRRVRRSKSKRSKVPWWEW